MPYRAVRCRLLLPTMPDPASHIELRDLLKGYMEGRLDSDQTLRLIELIDANADDRDLLWLLEGMMGEATASDGADPEALKQVFEGILARTTVANRKLDPAETPSKRRTYRTLTVYGLILAIVAGAGILLTMTGRPTGRMGGELAEVSSSLPPATGRAVLTKGDGSVIILDELPGRTISEGGIVRAVKADSALLSYASDTMAEGRNSTARHTLTTPRGGFYRLVLPDGSRLWLSAASSVTYPVAFVGNERRVKVTGEVYFEVVRDVSRPFIVEAGAVAVEVLGTRFDIRAYADDENVITALVEGAVRVRSDRGGHVLRPGQLSIVDVRNGEHQVVPANLDQVLAWRNGEFYFDAADIGSIMREVERWYDVTVRYPRGRPLGHYRGRPSRSLTLDQMLSVFEYSGLRYRIEGRELLIYE